MVLQKQKTCICSMIKTLGHDIFIQCLFNDWKIPLQCKVSTEIRKVRVNFHPPSRAVTYGYIKFPSDDTWAKYWLVISFWCSGLNHESTSELMQPLLADTRNRVLYESPDVTESWESWSVPAITGCRDDVRRMPTERSNFSNNRT